jgi:hypothetical protein
MTDYPRPAEAEMANLERTLGEDMTVGALLSKDVGDKTSGRVSVRRLYAQAVDDDTLAADDLDMIIAANPPLRTAYQRMLRTLAMYHFPAVRAAGTEWAPHREIGGCHIDLSEDDGQLFVIIELPGDMRKFPESLPVINEAGIARRVTLPEALRGVIHFPIVEDEELVMLLRDPNSEVFLV